MSTLLPTRIGKYDVVGLIGRGGTGLVYDAVDPHLDRHVAIKSIAGAFPRNADVLKHFLAEAQLMGSLQHPNIVNIYDVGVYEENPYVVMQYLEGESLDSALNSGRDLSLLDKINIVIQVCQGLAYAHRRGIPHYDIKPGNIMLCKDGSIRILDFGIAHAVSQTLTRSGEVIGSVKNSAPEQVDSQMADYRADIFSTGVVFYHLLSGHLPFEGDSTASTILKILHEPPLPLNTFLSIYPPGVVTILLRAMARNPEERYPSADDFSSDLEHLLGQLKEEVVSQEMQEASSLVERGELLEAQRSLLRVLKVDHQHSSAIRLLGDVQRTIQLDEISKPVLGLWVQAEKALADEHFEEAREHAEQALALDPDDAELQQLRETIRVEATRTERLHTILNVAQTAKAEGNLDAARNAAEEAMELTPNNAEAMALYQLISREILERARGRQIENYLRNARQEISSRRFTGAIEMLRRAEELDPSAPGVQSLIRLAASGQQQELRREAIESLSDEIQDALNRDDYRTAVQKSDEALARFPQERILIDLKAQAEVQFQLAERNRIVDAELAAAQGLFQTGHNQEAKERLLQLLGQLGSEPRLLSLLTAVTQELNRQSIERHRSEELHKASKALTQQAYDDAIQILQGLTKEFDADTELHQRLGNAQSERTDALRTALHGAQEEPDMSRSKSILETALQKIPGDEQLREKLAKVSHLDQMVSKNVAEARKLEDAGHYDLALAKWEMIRVLHPRHPDLKNAPKRIRDLQEHARADSRQTWIDRIERAMHASDYTEALSLVGTAGQEFPWDSDLMGLQEKTEWAIRQRAKAQKLLEEAQRLLSKQQWEVGARTMVRAYHAAPDDFLIRNQVVDMLSLASRDAIHNTPHASEVILQQLAQIEPNRAVSAELPTETQESRQDTSSHATGASVSINPHQVAEPTVASQGSPLCQEMFIPANVLIDNVLFTVTAPGSLPRGAVSEIQFWVHAERQRETVLKRIREVNRPDDTEIAMSPDPLPHGVCMSVRLRLSGGLTCVDSHKWIRWTDEIGSANFVITVPSEVPEGDLVGLASIRLNGCQIAKLSFLLKIGSKMLASQAIPCQTVLHRRAFASYVGEDRDEVLARVQGMEAAFKGLRVYVDAPALRSATYWEPELYGRINAADVFYLFWCRHTMVSDWVSREWRWALKSKGLDFIDPVPLDSPDNAPAPIELAAKHFNDPRQAFASLAGTRPHHP